MSAPPIPPMIPPTIAPTTVPKGPTREPIKAPATMPPPTPATPAPTPGPAVSSAVSDPLAVGRALRGGQALSQPGPCRCVIGSAFAAAHVAVDAGVGKPLRGGRREQEVVEPQPGVALPAHPL